MRRRLTWAEQLVEEGLEKGLEKGVEKGREIGKQEGLEQGVRQTLLRQLGLRFGPLSDDVKRRVEEIHSVERLSQIADTLLRISVNTKTYSSEPSAKVRMPASVAIVGP